MSDNDSLLEWQARLRHLTHAEQEVNLSPPTSQQPAAFKVPDVRADSPVSTEELDYLINVLYGAIESLNGVISALHEYQRRISG